MIFPDLGHFGGPYGSQNDTKKRPKIEGNFGDAFSLGFDDFGSLFGGISESILTNFRVVARNGRGAFRLRRRSRIEGRSSPKQAKNEREGRKNPGFDARQYFSRFLALLGSILEPKKVQKCSQN